VSGNGAPAWDDSDGAFMRIGRTRRLVRPRRGHTAMSDGAEAGMGPVDGTEAVKPTNGMFFHYGARLGRRDRRSWPWRSAVRPWLVRELPLQLDRYPATFITHWPAPITHLKRRAMRWGFALCASHVGNLLLESWWTQAGQRSRYAQAPACSS